jgi:hypothetical protein
MLSFFLSLLLLLLLLFSDVLRIEDIFQYTYIYILCFINIYTVYIYIENDIIFNLFVCLKHCLGIWTLCTCASVQRPDTFTVYIILSIRLLFNHIHRLYNYFYYKLHNNYHYIIHAFISAFSILLYPLKKASAYN